jgi:pyruvate formate lyase activating enzyme
MQVCPLQAVTAVAGTISRDYAKCWNCSDKPCIDECPSDALSLTGSQIEPADLLDAVTRDIPFYRNSGGGVTFSGGEPFQQPEFLLEMLGKCRDAGIHSAIETCGWTTEPLLRAAMPLTDLFLFDLKIVDPDLHLRYTGQPVDRILENLALLAAGHSNVVIRFPLVPGITDTRENLQNIVKIMQKNSLARIDLEPYHTLGIDKYEEHGMSCSLPDIQLDEPGRVEEISTYLTSHGLEALY